MSWTKQNPPHFKNCLRGALVLWAMCTMLACGVKGDPLPPEKPVELGRGRPTYKRATEGIPIERAKPKKEQEDEDDETR